VLHNRYPNLPSGPYYLLRGEVPYRSYCDMDEGSNRGGPWSRCVMVLSSQRPNINYPTDCAGLGAVELMFRVYNSNIDPFRPNQSIPAAQHVLTTAQQNAGQMDTLLDFSRTGNGSFRVCDGDLDLTRVAGESEPVIGVTDEVCVNAVTVFAGLSSYQELCIGGRSAAGPNYFCVYSSAWLTSNPFSINGRPFARGGLEIFYRVAE
jgi:hypothetical protein